MLTSNIKMYISPLFTSRKRGIHVVGHMRKGKGKKVKKERLVLIIQRDVLSLVHAGVDVVPSPTGPGLTL